jgi:hypothetical protein
MTKTIMLVAVPALFVKVMPSVPPGLLSATYSSIAGAPPALSTCLFGGEVEKPPIVSLSVVVTVEPAFFARKTQTAAPFGTTPMARDPVVEPFRKS